MKKEVTKKTDEKQSIPEYIKKEITIFHKRFHELTTKESRRTSFMKDVFNEDYPFITFQNIILDIPDREIRFQAFMASVKPIKHVRCTTLFYFHMICGSSGYIRNANKRITDPRVIDMFENIPNAISISVELLNEKARTDALKQLVHSHCLNVDHETSDNKSSKNNKRKSNNSLLPDAKRQKTRLINNQAVLLVQAHYQKIEHHTKWKLVNCDQKFWDDLHTLTFKAENPIETFMVCMEIVKNQDEKHKFVHGFLMPAEDAAKYLAHPLNGRNYHEATLDTRAWNLLSKPENFKRVEAELAEGEIRHFKTFFKAHIEVKSASHLSGKSIHLEIQDIDVEIQEIDQELDQCMEKEVEHTLIQKLVEKLDRKIEMVEHKITVQQRMECEKINQEIEELKASILKQDNLDLDIQVIDEKLSLLNQVIAFQTEQEVLRFCFDDSQLPNVSELDEIFGVDLAIAPQTEKSEELPFCFDGHTPPKTNNDDVPKQDNRFLFFQPVHENKDTIFEFSKLDQLQ